jgi:hypothetical protein
MRLLSSPRKSFLGIIPFYPQIAYGLPRYPSTYSKKSAIAKVFFNWKKMTTFSVSTYLEHDKTDMQLGGQTNTINSFIIN